MSVAPRQAAVLIGGLGTRLGALTRDIPKPLLPVAGRPFLDHLLHNIRRYGFDQILLLAGYKADVVEREYGPHSDLARCLDAEIAIVRESEPLGTGGALRAAAAYFDEQFFLFNGDSFFDINLLALSPPVESELGALALRELEDPSRYGVVELEGRRIRAFQERANTTGPASVNSGIYHLRREILTEIPDGSCSLERDIFPVLAAAGQLAGQIFEGFFIDIGIPDDLARAEIDVPAALRRPAVFFDRDGVLNEDAGYTHRVEDLRWIEGAREAIRTCNDAGCYVFVITNQAGVARGIYEEDAVKVFHRAMNDELREIGAHIDDFRYCPHHTEGTVDAYRKACDWRKPEPGMLLDLMQAWPIDISRSFVIGDKPSDLEAAAAAGLVGYSYKGGALSNLVAGLLAERVELRQA